MRKGTQNGVVPDDLTASMCSKLWRRLRNKDLSRGVGKRQQVHRVCVRCEIPPRGRCSLERSKESGGLVFEEKTWN